MNQLAAALPDEPRWLEPRGMLLTGRSTIFGGTTVEDGFVVRLVHGAFSAMAVVGRPPCEAILSAIDGTTALTPIVAQTVDAAHVAQCLESADQAWSGERAILHLLTAPAPRPAPAPHLDVRLLTHGDSLDHLPAGLRHEMTHAQDVAPVAAVFVEGRSSSFCYVEAFEDNGGVRVIAVLDAERKRAVPRERKMTTAAVAEPVVLRRAPFNTGAALVASGLILIGALYLALTYTWRQAALFLVGAGAGVVLYHAAFGFTSAWRKLIAEGRSDGRRAQMVMLAVTCAVFLPLLADGQVFGRFLRGSVSPVGLSVLIGAFIFGIGMQLGGGCASGTLYSAGGGSVRMHFGIVLGALAAAGLAGRFAPVWRVPLKSLTAAVVGGLLLGYGARIAYGCNIGAYFSGIASSSVHGWAWFASAFAGNVIGTRLRPLFGLRV